MGEFDVAVAKTSLHFVEADSRQRAELVKVGTSIGCHCEIYSDYLEVAAYPPRSGIIFVRDRIESGGIALVLERLLECGISLPVVAMDVDLNPARIVEAIKGGALDYLALPLNGEQLANCLLRIGPEAEEACAARRRMIDTRKKMASLSARERQVFEAILKSETNEEIAKRLKISSRTIEAHRGRMMSKLELRRTADAVKLGMETGSRE